MALKPDVVLQPHQESARTRFRAKPGLLINHGLGSGKTLTSMALAEDVGGRALVVVPASLQANYRDQLQKFVTEDRHGDYDIVSYDKFRADPESYLDKEPSVLIVDEVHRLRNPGKNRDAIEMARKRIPRMVGMTASLASNTPLESVPLINLVAGKSVISQAKFKRDHIGEIEVKPGLAGRLLGAESGYVPVIINRKGLHDKLAPFVDRYTGSDAYRKSLPGRVDEVVEVPMSAHQKDVYEGIINTSPALAYKIRQNLPPSKKELKDLNAFQTAARQVMNATEPYVDVREGQDLPSMSPKLQRVADDLAALAKDDPNFRAVVYSNFLDAGTRPVLRATETASGLYEGSVSQKERQRVLARYHSGEAPVLGLSPAGGEGLDLKGTKMMAVLESHWNPEVTNQAIGRAIRYKSHDHLPEDERSVIVRQYRSVYPDSWRHRISGRPTSMDEYIATRAQEKATFNEDFMNALDSKPRSRGVKAAFKVAGIPEMAARLMDSDLVNSNSLGYSLLRAAPGAALSVASLGLGAGVASSEDPNAPPQYRAQGMLGAGIGMGLAGAFAPAVLKSIALRPKGLMLNAEGIAAAPLGARGRALHLDPAFLDAPIHPSHPLSWRGMPSVAEELEMNGGRTDRLPVTGNTVLDLMGRLQGDRPHIDGRLPWTGENAFDGVRPWEGERLPAGALGADLGDYGAEIPVLGTYGDRRTMSAAYNTSRRQTEAAVDAARAAIANAPEGADLASLQDALDEAESSHTPGVWSSDATKAVMETNPETALGVGGQLASLAASGLAGIGGWFGGKALGRARAERGEGT